MAIDKELFIHLESTVVSHNLHYAPGDKNKIMMDKAVFLVDYICYQKNIRKDDVTEKGHIRIPSKILNIYLQKELNKYTNYLKNNNFINTIPYSKEQSQSYGYKVCFSENRSKTNKEKKEYLVYEFLNLNYKKHIIKSMEKNVRIERKKLAADRNTRHLTKWINEDNIQIDWKSAFKYIDNDKSLKVEQKDHYSYSLTRIRFHKWYYLRSVNDNRLHSNLTNLPSNLRKFLSHKSQKLVSLDVKTSQPYLLAGIFNLIIENKVGILEFLKQGLRSKEVKDKLTTVMNSTSLSYPTITNFKDYKFLVCNEDIYNHIGANLSPKFITSIKSTNPKGGYIDKVYNASLGHKVKKHFKDLRSYCKVLVLEYMYCSTENDIGRLKEIRRIYPTAVNKFIYNFKYCKELNIPKRKGKKKRTKIQREKIDKSKKLFSKFLQQLEAFLILDVLNSSNKRNG